jgi:putative glutamine amidotransferase
MSRPLIALSAAMEPQPTAFGEVDCTKVTAAYTHGVYAADGQPVILPVTEGGPSDLLERMDGLLLTGGGDLNPAMYGEPADPTVYGVCKDRDLFEAALYREAVDRGLPVLAFCRGMQLINVLHGGNLLQQVPGHWQARPAAEPHHQIAVTSGSALADAMGEGLVGVNSYHHQAINELGVGLHVTAVCGEVVEAVEADDADVVAVQWHPEHMAPTDSRQRRLFESFVRRAATAARTRTQEGERNLCPTT